jgi:nucleotide-binding universal stress UspA family protein
MTSDYKAPTDGSRRTIVVGVDRSRSARVALEHAERRAGPAGRLIVATVVTPISDAFGGAVRGLRDDRRAAAQELVQRLAADVAVETETRVLDGSPAERLAELAREAGADEIVVGSRGFGRLRSLGGSVSHAVLNEADRPVVVIPADAAAAAA